MVKVLVALAVGFVGGVLYGRRTAVHLSEFSDDAYEETFTGVDGDRFTPAPSHQ